MADLFRFRCSECQKLLGVSPRKVGKPVNCPSCGTELIVPAPDDTDDAEEATEFDGLGIDLGFSSPLDIHPVAPLPSPQPADRPADELEAIAFLARVAESPPIESTSPSAGFDFNLPPDPVDDPESAAEADPEPFVETPPEPLVPRSRRGRRLEVAVDRRRDVVLPRTAVVAWAMFAILALGFSFVAGLMIGHYRWR